ncbi:MAG: type 4a pilus biogenesis protein PilO [Armatimonadota bacterium]
MSGISERDQRTLKLGGIAVVVLILVTFVGGPIADYWKGIQDERTRVQGELIAIQDALNDQVSLTQTKAGLEKLATIHETEATLNSQTARLLQQVEQLAGYERMRVQRLEGLPGRADEEYYRSGVSLQFRGQLTDVHQFLDSVGKAAPGIKVERLTVTAAQDDPSRVEGQMVLYGYAVVMQGGNG